MEINKKYGYIRVSSKSQESNSSIKSQKEQLIQNGIQTENIRIEVGSGANEIKNRPVFQKLMEEELKPNDLLMVTKIDRCSRNTLEFLKLQDILFKQNITFVALDLPTSVDLATNKLIATTLSGIAEFENITHAEAKNAVGSAIEIADGFDANIWKQGKKIGKKSVWQKRFWSNTSRTSEVPNLNSDAYLPESVNNTLTVVDCYDVPNFEKQTMNSAINFGAKNDTNLIILNNRTNI